MATNVYLKSKIEERTSQAQVLANLQELANREKRDLTEDERKTFDSIVGRLSFLDQEIERITKAEEGSAKFIKVYGSHLEAQAQADAERNRRDGNGRPQRAPEERGVFRTWGSRFTASEQFAEYRKHGHGTSGAFEITGPFLDGVTGRYDTVEERQSGPIHGDAFDVTGTVSWPTGQNIMATSPSGAADFAPTQQWAGPTFPTERFPLFNVIGRVPTNMGSIEYYYWYPDLEAMASEVPEGQVKPEARLSGEIRAMPVATYAWWKGITRQALDDIPMIRGVVDTMLRRGVVRRINAEASTALTEDENIPELDDSAAGLDLLGGIRFAIAQVDDAGYTPNAVLLNPYDWAAFDVSIQQLLGTTGDINRVFWGLTPVSVPGLESGTCYVGDMREAMTFFDRQQTTLLMTDSHGEYFLRNKMVLLAEARGKMAVTNAAAAVKVEGDVPTIAGLAGHLSAQGTSASVRGGAGGQRAVSAPAQPARARTTGAGGGGS
jgi:hypothetical protein